MDRRLLLCTFLLLISLAACDTERFSPGRPFVGSAGPSDLGNDGLGSSTQLSLETPLFDGLENMIAGDGTIYFSWKDAIDNNDDAADISYRLYLASEPGAQDFTNSTFELPPGKTSFLLEGLENDVPVFAVLRAVDTEGNEDPNTAEWPALPNPIVYIALGGNGDGSTPGNPSQFISLPPSTTNANFYVQAGQHGNIPQNLDNKGISFYGGFDASFDVANRNPEKNDTVVFPIVPLLVAIDLDSTSALSCVDGFIVIGGPEGDPSPDGQGNLLIKRGIEVGHIFQLGDTKCSKYI